MSRSLTPLTAPACNSFNSLANSLTALASCAALTVGTANNVVDHIVQATIRGPATVTGSLLTVINLWVYGSIDGTTWAGSGTTNELVDGTDRAIAWSANGNNAIFLGTIYATTTAAGTSINYKSEPLSVAAAFGGTLPAKYVIVLQNQSGAALASTGHSIAVTEVAYS
jgi:hypothetical protein